MFNQEMPAEYKPRKYMIRGVLNDAVHGSYYEIVRRGKATPIYSIYVYAFAVLLCDLLNSKEILN